jgi:hypothetical protein
MSCRSHRRSFITRKKLRLDDGVGRIGDEDFSTKVLVVVASFFLFLFLRDRKALEV